MYKTLILALVCFVSVAQAQTNNNPLIVNFNISLPQDSVLSNNLVRSINDFLLAAQKPIEENYSILPAERLETSILLDEFAGIEKRKKFKEDYFYKPYLSSVVVLKDKRF